MDDRQRNRTLAVLFVGVLMGALDIAIVGPALPAIQAEFGLDSRAASWIFSSYVLANLIGTPLMAKLSDLFGRRAIYVLDVSAVRRRLAGGRAVARLRDSSSCCWSGAPCRASVPAASSRLPAPSSATPSRRRSAAVRSA